MKATLIFITLSFCQTLVFALEPYSATYSATWFGFKIGSENRSLSVKDGIYYYHSDAKGKTPFKEYKFSAKSTFTIDDSGVRPISYQEKNIEDDVIKSNKNFELNGDEIDRLSLFIAIPDLIRKNPTKKNLKFKVNNGKNITIHNYQIKNINKDYVEVIEKDKKIEIKFSKTNNYLPIFYKIKNVRSILDKVN